MATISNESLEKATQIIAKHYPDETPAELLTRMQHLLKFMESLPEKLLAYSTQKHPVPAHQTGILPQFNHNKSIASKPEAANLKQDQIRAALLKQIMLLQESTHLEPAQKVSARVKPR